MKEKETMRAIKKLLLLAIMGSLASCGGKEGEKQSGAQAQTDSAVNFKKDSIARALDAQNAAIINAEAQRLADSIKTANAAGTTTTRHGNTARSIPTVTPPPPAPATPVPPHPTGH